MCKSARIVVPKGALGCYLRSIPTQHASKRARLVATIATRTSEPSLVTLALATASFRSNRPTGLALLPTHGTQGVLTCSSRCHR